MLVGNTDSSTSRTAELKTHLPSSCLHSGGWEQWMKNSINYGFLLSTFSHIRLNRIQKRKSINNAVRDNSLQRLSKAITWLSEWQK